MVAFKKHSKDDLINYLVNVLKLMKNSMLGEKDLKKLLKLLVKPEESKVIGVPLVHKPPPLIIQPALKGIHES